MASDTTSKDRPNDFPPAKNNSSPAVATFGWNGPDDPQNPMNWPPAKKARQITLMGINSFVASLASTMIAPSISEVLREFDSSSGIVGPFIVSSFQLGYTVGPLLIAPLSEVYGRVPLYHTCNLLFCIFIMASGLSKSLAQIIVFRVFSGIAGVCPLVIGSGTIADMVHPKDRAGVLAVWSLGPLLGPVLSPIIGGVLGQRKGWRWTFWLCLILAGTVLLVSYFIYNESYAPVILRRKSLRLLKDGDAIEGSIASQPPIFELLKKAVRRPLKLFFRSPIVTVLSLYIGVTFGYFYLLFTTFTSAFESVYGFSQQSAGFCCLGFGVGAILGAALYSYFANSMATKLVKKGSLTPESRLLPAMFGCLFLPVGLFWYGWTMRGSIHWIVPIIGTSFFGFGLVFSFLPLNAYLIDSYTIYASSATTVNTTMRSLMGGFLPLAGPHMYKVLGLGWGNSVLAFIALAFSITPFFFWRFGAGIRKRTDPKLNL